MLNTGSKFTSGNANGGILTRGLLLLVMYFAERLLRVIRGLGHALDQQDAE